MAGAKWAIGSLVLVVASLFCFNAAHAAGWSDSPEAVSPDRKSPPPNLAGSWSGTGQDALFGATTVSLDITQKKSIIGGTFDVSGPGGGQEGTITNGTVNGNKGTVKFNLRAGKNCAPAATATLSNGNTTMTGSYFKNTKHCHANGTFTVDLAP